MKKRCSVEIHNDILKKTCIYYDFDNDEKIEEITVFKDMKELERILLIYNGKLLKNVYYISDNNNTKIVDDNYYKIIEKISNYRIQEG